jgi:hypothetical protein
MDTGYRANTERFAEQMEVFDRMREINAAARRATQAPVNATRERTPVRAAAPHSDAARAFAPGGVEVEPSYPSYIDLTRLTKSP